MCPMKTAENNIRKLPLNYFIRDGKKYAASDKIRKYEKLFHHNKARHFMHGKTRSFL